MINRMIKGAWLGVAALWAGAAAVPAAETKDGEAYPIDVCIVSGMKLGSMGDPYVHDYEGRKVLFCCAGCIGKFEKDATEYLKKLDQAVIEKRRASYPLTTCVVSGEKLGGHGPIYDLVYQNRLVRLCCEGCVSDFEAEPDEFLKKIDDAVKE